MQKRLFLLLFVFLGFFNVFFINNSPIARASTFVEGHISQDTTWTYANSPYIVAADVTVDSNTTLAIEAGVQIRFGDGLSIDVRGNLRAEGEEGNPIVFTSNRISPNPPFVGCWKGLSFTIEGSTTPPSIVKNCLIEYANNGICLEYSIDSPVSIKDTEIDSCYYGIQFFQIDYLYSPFASLVEIEGNLIHGCTGAAIYAWESSNVTISGNTIFDSREGILVFGSSFLPSRNISISRNLIHSLRQDGSTPEYRNGVGIELFCVVSDVRIFENEIRSNTAGIYVNIGPVSNLYVAQNIIKQNRDYGVRVAQTSMLAVNNSISENGCGMYFHSGASVTANYNNIFSNTQGVIDFYAQGSNCENNYWGDSTGPYHVSLNPTGQGNNVSNGVDFTPFLSVPATVPEFPQFFILPLFMIVTLLAVIVYRRKPASRS